MKSGHLKVHARKQRPNQPAAVRAASSLAKITRPRLPPVSPRPRLYAWLDEAARRTPVIWLEGPPGAGKTTLAASWLTARKSPALWYQVDAGDRDLASFFHFLGVAVSQAAPRYRTPLPTLTSEYLAGFPVFTRNFFRELARRLKPPFVLVLDNLQEVGADAPLYEALREGLEELPPGACAVLVSRAQPPEAFARWRLEQRLGLLDWTALRFSEDESIALVQHLSRSAEGPVSIEQARTLHSQCDGWLAGMLLLLQGARAAPDVQAPFAAELAKTIADSYQVLAPPRVEAFQVAARRGAGAARGADGLTRVRVAAGAVRRTPPRPGE